ncbi:4-hydroxyphenylpyruvate dioxygenase [Actinocrinis puniceicyclus]|uniref:4-hydroxyphenylpyruvate dioxygenase n=1 Tax=Actinocrinis puniceicyclus TaxID=977794 RepID=A0A8J7WRV0_9ACTN|nr:4-hydroxyphenylpyruvate dioxygenase [Actinocrinis puniceicyclus]MBS2964425.1 4-hydroxyphenylpyruvate dioxygenase [Actinocrinis puniceicyclus]
MAILGIAHTEFHVQDADAAAERLIHDYGFVARRRSRGGAELGLGGISLVLTEAAPGNRAQQYVERHGDGVAVIALGCEDPQEDYARAVGSGADVIDAAQRTVAGFGDVALSFVEPGAAAHFADFAAGAQPWLVDHVALCVPAGELKDTVRFCEQALGFARTFAEYVSVGEQGMDSVVVQSPSNTVTFTLLEPDTDRAPGQIDGFLAAHGGPGVQHLALRTGDIACSVRTLAQRGVGFLSTPDTYYDALAERLGGTDIPVDTLRELNILMDQDHGGRLFQIFTRSTHPRGTFFFELIERRGAAGFGTANIKALYEAVERQRSAANG